MFRDQATDPGQHPPEVELDTARAERRLRGAVHLQDHEPGAWLEHPSRLAPGRHRDPSGSERPSRHRAVEGLVGNGSSSASAATGVEPRATCPGPAPASPARSRRRRSAPRNPRRRASVGRRGPGFRRRGRGRFLPASVPTPAVATAVRRQPLVESKADDAVEQVVRGRDGSEDRADVGPLLRPAGNR